MAGKSTLLTILGGLQVPTEGAVRIGGADLSSLPGDGLADFRRETIGCCGLFLRSRWKYE